ncbi:PREDICTED: uncharacterized protein LOC109236775 [Nicotiana attenuata]|uniref:uncharacterized protein LOC109236775 n=1 Tax=Nicotiana attenuata TaxID=49451 RepID=UPI00090578EA|nr:PREDICTED: uncharacterized protein LOC109236775 [Nicotiana attenuata]
MPPKSTTAQKGKSVAEELRGAPAPAPAPVHSAPQPDAPGQEMRDAIQLLTQLVAAQARHQEIGIGRADSSISARVHDFINLDPPVFTRADPNEDPQEFTEAFLRRYLPPELRRARVDRFLTLRQGNMSVRQYNLQFDSLARASGSQYRGELNQMRPPMPRCAQCGKQHTRQCRMGLGICYTCGYSGHIMRDCPMRGDASIAQPVGSVAGSSSSIRFPGQGLQAPMSRSRGRDRASSSSSPQNRIYALAG